MNRWVGSDWTERADARTSIKTTASSKKKARRSKRRDCTMGPAETDKCHCLVRGCMCVRIGLCMCVCPPPPPKKKNTHPTKQPQNTRSPARSHAPTTGRRRQRLPPQNKTTITRHTQPTDQPNEQPPNARPHAPTTGRRRQRRPAWTARRGRETCCSSVVHSSSSLEGLATRRATLRSKALHRKRKGGGVEWDGNEMEMMMRRQLLLLIPQFPPPKKQPPRRNARNAETPHTHAPDALRGEQARLERAPVHVLEDGQQPQARLGQRRGHAVGGRGGVLFAGPRGVAPPDGDAEGAAEHVGARGGGSGLCGLEGWGIG